MPRGKQWGGIREGRQSHQTRVQLSRRGGEVKSSRLSLEAQCSLQRSQAFVTQICPAHPLVLGSSWDPRSIYISCRWKSTRCLLVTSTAPDSSLNISQFWLSQCGFYWCFYLHFVSLNSNSAGDSMWIKLQLQGRLQLQSAVLGSWMGGIKQLICYCLFSSEVYNVVWYV